MFPVPVPVRRSTVRYETASGVAVLGGTLVLLQGFLFAVGPSWPWTGLAVGAAIVGLGALASFRPRGRDAIGGGIVLLGLVSLYSGGGFYLGALLSVVGGILIAYARSPGSPGRHAPGSFSDSLGPPCPNCGRRIPTWTSKCPYCGFP